MHLSQVVSQEKMSSRANSCANEVSTLTSNPNVIENISGSLVGLVSSFDKLEMQSAFVLDSNSAIAVVFQDDFSRQAIRKGPCVSSIQVSSSGANGKVHRAAVITFATIEAIATERRRGRK